MENKIVENKTAVVTGAGGTICSLMAVDLAKKGYNVVLVGRNLENLKKVENEILIFSGNVISISADVTNEEQIVQVREQVNARFGVCSLLINGAGGNQPDAVTTVSEFSPVELNGRDQSFRGFFNLDMKKFLNVIEVNIMGTVIPSFVFARDMAQQGGGTIINFASMNTYRPLSRVPAYALSKAGIANFTQWLAAYLAPANIRVNAIAPGFFLNDRSRKLLLQEDGNFSPRGNNILQHTPMKKFGEAKELIGCMNWLIDDEAASYVTGVTIPVDGGFLSSSGI